MTPDRFLQLVDAYGGDLRRWPTDERERARELAARRGDLVTRLHEAAALDDVLAWSRAPVPSAALLDRVLEAAPRAAARGLTLDWLTGLGLAGACAAGLAMGVLIQPAPAIDDAAPLAALAPYEPPFGTDAEAG